jgi:ribosomal protein L29
MAEAIVHYREIDFQQIEETVVELKERFSNLRFAVSI